jgi:hypothetical protein
MKIRYSTLTDGRTDRHDEANSRLSQFCESTLKKRSKMKKGRKKLTMAQRKQAEGKVSQKKEKQINKRERRL